MTIRIRTLSLALTAVVTLSASSAAFSGDNPREIKFLSSYSWGTGCPFNSVDVHAEKEALFGLDLENSVEIFYAKRGHMKLKAFDLFDGKRTRWCITSLTFKVPAGVTFGNITSTFNTKFSVGSRYDTIEVDSKLNALEANFFDPIRKDSWYKEGFSIFPRNNGFDYGAVGDIYHTSCGIDRLVTLHVTNKVSLRYYNSIKEWDTRAYAELEGVFLKFDIKNGSNGVACDGYDWEDEALGNIKPAY